MKYAAKCILIFTFFEVPTRVENRVSHMEPYIVGGHIVDIRKYPHSAFLSIHCKGLPGACGSSVLNQKMVLTAAHCTYMCNIKSKSKDRIDIMVGNNNIQRMSNIKTTIDCVVHQDYDEKNIENDVALLVIAGTFHLGNNVKRVVISRQFPDARDVVDSYVAGWGVVNDSIMMSSKHLKYAHQKLRSAKTCAAIGKLHIGMFCAGSLTTGDHASQGDSGSALVMKNGFHQIGLVSFRISAYPAMMVYTNVSYYYDWITENAKSLYCKNKGQ